MKNKSGIYEILNTVNGKRYIGSAVKLGARWNKHLRELRKEIHHNAPLQAAYHKYGEATLQFNVLFECERHELTMFEQAAMDYLKPEYNVAKDARQPMRGRKHSAATKAKMSEKSTGRKKTPEQCAAMSLARRGVKYGPRSDESRARTSAALKGKAKSVAHRRALSEANKGKQPAPQTIEKLRLANTGRTLSEEAKEKIAASKRGKKRKPFTAQAKANMTLARKKDARLRWYAQDARSPTHYAGALC